MTTMRKLVRAQISAVGDDEVEVVMSTDALARDGHILIPQGCVLENYRANPIVLWSHDPDHPIANAMDVVVGPDQITARVRFAPAGISRKADEIRGLTKAGVIRAVSVGFDAIDGEPLDPKKPRGGLRISAWELLELSFVSVPADTGALVTARALGEDPMTDATETGAPPKARTRTNPAVRGGKVVFRRGLYQVAQLCYLFEELGWHVDMAQWEALVEGDESKLPAMLGGILSDLGEALIAMTEEEIAEALAGHDVEPDADDDAGDAVLEIEARQHIAAAKTPALRAFRRGIAHAKLRAGKTLSSDTADCLRDALACHEDAMAMHRSAIRKHKEGMAAISDLMDRAGVSDPDDDTTQTLQTSDGVDESDGAENGRTAPAHALKQRAPASGSATKMTPGFRRRQADALRLKGLQ
jgi:HK97 family phage prohead protease